MARMQNHHDSPAVPAQRVWSLTDTTPAASDIASSGQGSCQQQRAELERSQLTRYVSVKVRLLWKVSNLDWWLLAKVSVQSGANVIFTA